VLVEQESHEEAHHEQQEHVPTATLAEVLRYQPPTRSAVRMRRRLVVCLSFS